MMEKHPMLAAGRHPLFRARSFHGSGNFVSDHPPVGHGKNNAAGKS
jgi:hypothetical protein